MTRKVPVIILTLVLVLITCIVIGIFVKLNMMEQKVNQYLIHEKGYAAADIHKIKGVFGKLPPFSVQVVFKDETDAWYYYVEKGNGRIIQMTSASDKPDHPFKHVEVE